MAQYMSKSLCGRSIFYLALLVALAIATGGCSIGDVQVSNAKAPNWPQTPGRSAEETRAIREAELLIYMDPEYAEKQQSTATANPSSVELAERASVMLGGESASSSQYGGLLFISAQLPVGPDGMPLPPGASIDAQTRSVLDKVRSVLLVNQLVMENVVSLTIYLNNLADLPTFDSVAKTYFPGEMPPRSVVEVSALPNGAALQVSAVAGR